MIKLLLYLKNFKICKGSRKGFTYVLVTTLMIAILLSIFFTASKYRYQDQESLQQVRIRAMNEFTQNLNNDIHRATYISAFRTLLALEDHVTTTGIYLTDINESFKETFYYGTINGTESQIMANSTFSDYVAKVSTISRVTGIFLTINVTHIGLVQSDPWNIDVHMLMNITLRDSKNTASWNINKEYITTVPIANLRDPLYSKNTFNKVPNTIRQLNSSMNSSMLFNATNTARLLEHINGSYYIASPYAPNFIMRFEGNTNADLNGIESIVNDRILFNPELIAYPDRIKIDYIYFNNLTFPKLCVNITTPPTTSPFIVPIDRKNLYQLQLINSTACP